MSFGVSGKRLTSSISSAKECPRGALRTSKKKRRARSGGADRREERKKRKPAVIISHPVCALRTNTMTNITSFRRGKRRRRRPASIATTAFVTLATIVTPTCVDGSSPSEIPATHIHPPQHLDAVAPSPLDERDVPPVVVDDASSALAANLASPTSNSNGRGAPHPSTGTGSKSEGGGWFGKILGGSKPSNDETSASNGGDNPPPPPPPPPPAEGMGTSTAQDPQGYQNTMGGYGWAQMNNQMMQPQGYGQYGQYPPQQMAADPNTYQNLLAELDESTLREMTLTHQIQNLTTLVSSMSAESDAMMNQVDALTEQLADSRSDFHFVHNRNLELDKNCSSLAGRIESLQEELAGREGSVSAVLESKAEDERAIAQLRVELRSATDELERLACLVETDRLEGENKSFMSDFRNKQVSKRKKGFWAWLFRLNAEPTKEELRMEEEERARAAQELARTTLLHALQVERSSVEELEDAVAALQRNNSAIMDVVSSRDSLIEELNSRVAVFEDDKMVLKAALRQLQMEIREEQPKTQKLIDDLASAREREANLKDEIEQLILEGEEEVQNLGSRLEAQVAEAEKTREELNLVGVYVDQLEDRLATFAIARKELELREAECERLEAEAKRCADDAKTWKASFEELASEQNETRPLLEELAKERAASRVKIEGLLEDIENLQGQVEDWQRRLQEAEKLNEQIKSESARTLFLKVEQEKAAVADEGLRKLHEERSKWEMQSEERMQQVLAEEQSAWKARAAEDAETLLSERRTEWESASNEEVRRRLDEQRREVETTMSQQWSAALDAQREKLTDDMRRELDSERAAWEAAKEEEIESRINAERAAWASVEEDKPDDDGLDETSSFEDEVKRAAEKVYARLEQYDTSSGVTDTSLNSLGGITGSTEVADGDPIEVSDSDSKDVQPSDSLEETSLTLYDAKKNVTVAKNEVPAAVSFVVPARSAVPFRSVRKAFSRATGLHGIVTPSSRQLAMRWRRNQLRLQQGANRGAQKPPPSRGGKRKRKTPRDSKKKTKSKDDEDDSSEPKLGQDDQSSDASGDTAEAVGTDGDASSSFDSTGGGDQVMGSGEFGADSWGDAGAGGMYEAGADSFAAGGWASDPNAEQAPPPMPEPYDPRIQ